MGTDVTQLALTLNPEGGELIHWCIEKGLYPISYQLVQSGFVLEFLKRASTIEERRQQNLHFVCDDIA